jgi:hypothetical protein
VRIKERSIGRTHLQ